MLMVNITWIVDFIARLENLSKNLLNTYTYRVSDNYRVTPRERVERIKPNRKVLYITLRFRIRFNRT